MGLIYNPTDLWPTAVLRRVPRGWTGEKQFHDMLLTRGLMVFHNTPERGEHLATLEEALAGINATQWLIPPELQEAAYARLIHAVQHPRPYDAAANNCQDTVNRIVYGVSQSRTRQAVIVVLGLSALAFWATRG